MTFKKNKEFSFCIKAIVLVFICFLFGCNSSDKKNESNQTAEVTKQNVSANEQWMHAINKKDLEALENLYTQNIYGLSPNGIDFSSRDTLIGIVKNNNFVVNDVQTIKRIEANNNYDYEIGGFKNAAGGLMKYIVIWNTSQEADKRALEFLAATDDAKLDLTEIDAQRSKWMKLCNAHNVENLINGVYTKNTMYYNNKPMVVGREQLIPIYSYMNNANYELTLHPIIVEPVSESIVYEIGQCEGSYNGKYILVWQKIEGNWQILFDSNI